MGDVSPLHGRRVPITWETCQHYMGDVSPLLPVFLWETDVIYLSSRTEGCGRLTSHFGGLLLQVTGWKRSCLVCPALWTVCFDQRISK
ncbi:hypothetical protein LSAT2_024632 [Lamellibrachia satsuma]|nr:hypothetical protein LSAT2_024632 [Lamellibrachia satsuma]